MSATIDSARSAGVQRVQTLRDPQVFALAVVLAANVKYALEQAVGGEKWLGNACVDFHPFPVTLDLLTEYRLPALSVWRVETATVNVKKKVERRASFAVRYWLASTGREWLPVMWGALEAAGEVIGRTLTGESLLDLTVPGPKGPRAIPGTELLKLAGFTRINENTISWHADFAQVVGAGNLYPVLNVTFEAEHEPKFGGLPYSIEFPNGVDLPLFTKLCFELWESGRPVENQPIVAGIAPREEP